MPKCPADSVYVQLGIFLSSMSIMEGRDSAHMKQKFKDLYVPLISANWQVWPLAQVCQSTLGGGG